MGGRIGIVRLISFAHYGSDSNDGERALGESNPWHYWYNNPVLRECYEYPKTEVGTEGVVASSGTLQFCRASHMAQPLRRPAARFRNDGPLRSSSSRWPSLLAKTA